MTEEKNNFEQDNGPVKRKGGLNFEKLILPGAIILAGVLISVAVFLSDKSGAQNQRPAGIGNNVGEQKAVSTDDDPFLGDQDAPVTVIEFSDYQCPFCRTFWKETLPLIKSEYIDTGKVMFVYRDFPLSIHAAAAPAAQAAECAGDQDKYWEMHDKIFIEQDKLGGGTIQFGSNELKKWAGEIGLNMNNFNSCLDSNKYADEVQNDFNDGRAAGVSGTPSIFINGRMLVGAQPFSVFKSLIEEELNK